MQKFCSIIIAFAMEKVARKSLFFNFGINMHVLKKMLTFFMTFKHNNMLRRNKVAL